ncbi:angiotensin-converting enzyme [Hyalella azteca]|uniref:Angiotensin-converting enzyme n=1 Tax=Hyalella azteca TaxID=294128 RepID=A0A8B7PEL9_HYAAZ|nr:angiotensin-converting enzyme [Hyalella azteca]
MSLLTLCFVVLLLVLHYIIDLNTLSVPEFLSDYDTRISALANAAVLAQWTWSTNITRHNQDVMDEAAMEEAVYQAQAYSKARWFLTMHQRGRLPLSEDQRRQLGKVGRAALAEPDRSRLAEVRANISATYARAQIRVMSDDANETKIMKLEPDLTNFMAANRSYESLASVWSAWRDEVGRTVRPHIKTLVELQNKQARKNGFADHGDFWRGKYETEGFEEQIASLNEQLSPLYRSLHAYVRHKLMLYYNDDEMFEDGLIPACILGDMWGRFWTDIYDIVEPYPDAMSVDPTPEMLKQNLTVLAMYHMADNFYKSMGLQPLPEKFYKLSMLERPEDGREVDCHGTAWDFLDGKDFRIRMCTQVNFKYLEVIHHELGHVQYFMQYAHLPYVYRDGANDGFHEGIGELMGMTLATVSHLKSIGLLPSEPTSEENTINFLMRTALKTVTTLPFHYVYDLWRWELFRGDIPEERWNQRFWELKSKYLGVKPPVARTEEHLDAFNIFHVNNDFDMIRYFTRTVLQFQFAGALCDIAGFEGPLHDCDFSNSTAAGEKLAAMLSLGSSKPWMDALEQLTGGRVMDAKAIIDYFAPLQTWITNYLLQHNQTLGWDNDQV